MYVVVTGNVKSVNGQGDFFFCDCDVFLFRAPCQIRRSSCLVELAGAQRCGIVEIEAEIRLDFEIFWKFYLCECFIRQLNLRRWRLASYSGWLVNEGFSLLNQQLIVYLLLDSFPLELLFLFDFPSSIECFVECCSGFCACFWVQSRLTNWVVFEKNLLKLTLSGTVHSFLAISLMVWPSSAFRIDSSVVSLRAVKVTASVGFGLNSARLEVRNWKPCAFVVSFDWTLPVPIFRNFW